MRTLLPAITLALSLFLAQASTSSGATSWHTFTNKKGQSFEGSVIEVDTVLEQATVVVKSTGRNSTIDFNILSDADIDYLLGWTPGATEPGAGEEAVPEQDLGTASGRLYPHTKKEIREKLAEILKRKPPEGIESKQQETVNLLNAYRYLCGVEPNAVADKKKVQEAHQAAAACQKHGGLSHSIGSYTNKCNLHSGGNMTSSVRGYINDGGANNREKRGHRRWCLNPKMVKTGFGDAGRYSAMWALDSSGAASKENYAYPGAGYFPKDYLHGNGWSFYSTGGVPSADKLEVEVFKLTRRPEKKFGITSDIPGRKVKVGYVHSYANVVNFEPDRETVSKGGIFWVKLRGGGLREAYL
ncbi:MAG: hypothetical protein ACR2RV_28525, partial [Verrucomicrobiales bacterium]